jgi:two-component system NarL family sensor kinase
MSTSVLLIIGTTAILTLAFFVIFFVLMHQKRMFENRALIKEKENLYQKKLLDASIEVAELEREKIATNIHDDVGTLLNVINLHLNRMARNEDNKELTRELIKESKELLESSIETIRCISRDLMPPILIRLGFENGIAELCRQVKISDEIDVEFIASKQALSLSKKTELQLYRIVQEAVNNIIKHAKATKITITIQSGISTQTIQITHNGKGISSDMINRLSAGKGGVGLRSIQSRAQMISASVQYITIADNESIITIEVPKDETTN